MAELALPVSEYTAIPSRVNDSSPFNRIAAKKQPAGAFNAFFLATCSFDIPWEISSHRFSRVPYAMKTPRKIFSALSLSQPCSHSTAHQSWLDAHRVLNELRQSAVSLSTL